MLLITNDIQLVDLKWVSFRKKKGVVEEKKDVKFKNKTKNDLFLEYSLKTLRIKI